MSFLHFFSKFNRKQFKNLMNILVDKRHNFLLIIFFLIESSLSYTRHFFIIINFIIHCLIEFRMSLKKELFMQKVYFINFGLSKVKTFFLHIIHKKVVFPYRTNVKTKKQKKNFKINFIIHI
jgi:hypothetical protein